MTPARVAPRNPEVVRQNPLAVPLARSYCGPTRATAPALAVSVRRVVRGGFAICPLRRATVRGSRAPVAPPAHARAGTRASLGSHAAPAAGHDVACRHQQIGAWRGDDAGFTNTVACTARLIGQRSGVALRFRPIIHATRAASGELAAHLERASTECRQPAVPRPSAPPRSPGGAARRQSPPRAHDAAATSPAT